jgi:hypothetical protein
MISESEIMCEASNTRTPIAIFVEYKKSSGDIPVSMRDCRE